MVSRTKTPWVLQVDGDEIYPLDTAITMRQMADVAADEVRYVFVKHRDFGEEGLWTLNEGNYTARLLRTEGLVYSGVYPGKNKILYKDVPLNMKRDRRDVAYLPEKYFYFHTTNLRRSPKDGDALNRGVKWHKELGTQAGFYPGPFPEVFGKSVKYSPFNHLLKERDK
jgi:hypothetical protein